jgi:hypothetical protein
MREPPGTTALAATEGLVADGAAEGGEEGEAGVVVGGL